jgi:hypothetical protein
MLIILMPDGFGFDEVDKPGIYLTNPTLTDRTRLSLSNRTDHNTVDEEWRWEWDLGHRADCPHVVIQLYVLNGQLFVAGRMKDKLVAVININPWREAMLEEVRRFEA